MRMPELTKKRPRRSMIKNINRRSFKEGQKVLLYHSRLKLFPGKLKSKWLGPFIITKVYTHGVVDIVSPSTGKELKVNGQRLKPYYEPMANEAVLQVLDLEDPIYGQ